MIYTSLSLEDLFCPKIQYCFVFEIQVSILSLAIEGSANLTALRSLRTLRALRPLRAISRWQGMKVKSFLVNIWAYVWFVEAWRHEIHLYYFLDRCQCLDVCHSVHYQRVVGVSSVLVDILYHGCSVFWWQIL